jgi:hypothetical protein
MIIKKINNNTIDVFFGEGWENWGRFKIKYGKPITQLFQIKGTRFHKKEFTKLEGNYNAN